MFLSVKETDKHALTVFFLQRFRLKSKMQQTNQYHLGQPPNRRFEGPGARFLKAPKSFRARKAIFRSSVSKNGEVHTPEASCAKGTSLHL